MVEVNKYHLFPTDLIPNSPRPLLHYKGVLAQRPRGSHSHCDPVEVRDLFHNNGWKVSWVFRYGQTQLSHYHSQAHECMAVLSGTAVIRFGVADTSEDLEENTTGRAWEDGGVELEAEAGDVFIIPAGVAHKTYNTKPEAEFKLLTRTARGLGPEDVEALPTIELSGYTMMGAYCGGDWDFVRSGGNYEKVWAVPKPANDPVFGQSEKGLCATWRGSQVTAQVDDIGV
ncbi:Fc.00g115340.m01.CDS01 [Cosmosporella sp. VM-42]